jgi:hypothetical protein
MQEKILFFENFPLKKLLISIVITLRVDENKHLTDKFVLIIILQCKCFNRLKIKNSRGERRSERALACVQDVLKISSSTCHLNCIIN